VDPAKVKVGIPLFRNCVVSKSVSAASLSRIFVLCMSNIVFEFYVLLKLLLLLWNLIGEFNYVDVRFPAPLLPDLAAGLESRPICKPRPAVNCTAATYGCCPNGKDVAKGPFGTGKPWIHP